MNVQKKEGQSLVTSGRAKSEETTFGVFHLSGTCVAGPSYPAQPQRRRVDRRSGQLNIRNGICECVAFNSLLEYMSANDSVYSAARPQDFFMSHVEQRAFG